MALTAKVSSQELSTVVNSRYVSKFVEGILVNAAGQVYSPGVTDDANFLANEVAVGLGGYQRAVFRWETSDLSAYADEGVSLSTKGTIFAHDGSENGIDFTHAVLIWAEGNLISVADATSTNPPTNLVDGTYLNLSTQTNNAGVGATIDIVVESGLVTSTTVNKFGTGYAINDALIISEGVLLTSGAIAAGTGGNLAYYAQSVSTNAEAGRIIAVAKTTSPVVLDGGNEAAFYWDLKLFGFNS